MKTNKFILTFLVIAGLSLFSCRYGTTQDLGKGYKLEYYQGGYGIINSQKIVIVFFYVMNFRNDSNFIVATQKPWDSIVVYGDSHKTFDEKRKIFKYSKFFQYWIIDKRNDNVYGPLHLQKFLGKFIELGVPDSLLSIMNTQELQSDDMNMFERFNLLFK